MFSAHSCCSPLFPLSTAFDVFVCGYSPILFVLEDEELLSAHPGFESLLTVIEFAKLLKTLVFRMIWRQVRSAYGHANSCFALSCFFSASQPRFVRLFHSFPLLVRCWFPFAIGI